jgi:hypothetical protein
MEIVESGKVQETPCTCKLSQTNLLTGKRHTKDFWKDILKWKLSNLFRNKFRVRFFKLFFMLFPAV